MLLKMCILPLTKVFQVTMAILTSSPSVPANFHRGPAFEGLPGSSHTQRGVSSIVPALQLVSGSSSSHHPLNAGVARRDAQGRQEMANGHSAGEPTTSSESPPDNPPPEQLNLIRARTAEHNRVRRSRPQISRTSTDLGPGAAKRAHPAEETGELRHGWEDQYNSSEFLGLLSSVSIRWQCCGINIC